MPPIDARASEPTLSLTPAGVPAAEPPPPVVGSVCVVGLGYIGLPTAGLLADRGYDVLGVDVAPEVVAALSNGRAHIREPDLDRMVATATNSGKLRVAHEPKASDVFIIAVPTPVGDDHQPDLSMVEAAARSIAPSLRPGSLVLLESTCPVGTTDGLLVDILTDGGREPREFSLAYCPERVLPGKILTELVGNDRIVGGVDAESADRAARFYRSFVGGQVITTDSRTAEMVKLAENSFRDVNLAYANELAGLCDHLGVDVWELIRLANHHPRVAILNPGPGVGGHCIPVDPWFLINAKPEAAALLTAARTVNDARPATVVQHALAAAAGFDDPVVACLGLAFKADVDDLRCSPAVKVARALEAALPAERLLVVEPNLVEHPEFELHSLDDALERSDVVVLLVDHTPFRALADRDWGTTVVLDTRGMLR